MKKPLQLAALLCGCLITTSVFAQNIDKGPGFRYKGWDIAASVSVGAFWESNAHNTTNDDESGAGWRVQPSLTLSRKLGDRSSFSSSLFYTMERGFDDEDAQDSDSYGLALNYTRTLNPRWRLSVSGSYSHSENDEFYGSGWDPANPTLPRIDTDKSDNYNVNVGLSYTGFQKWNLSIGAGWSRSDYDDSWGSSSDNYTLSVTAGRRLGQRTSWDFSLSASAEDPDNGDTSTSYTLMTGIAHSISNRLSLRAMVGASFQDYQGYSDDTSVDPSYSLSLSYRLSQRVALALSLNSRYESEYYNGAFYNAKTTYVWSHNLTGSVTVQWSDKLYSSLSLSGFYEEHVATAPGLSDRDRTYIQVACNTSYRFNNYVSMYGSVSWKNDQYDGNGDDSADDIRLDVGLTFTL